MISLSYVFWDNDGVLVDTERLYFRASQEALGRIGISLEDRQFASLSLVKGRSIFDLAEQQGHSKKTLQRLRNWRNRRYSELVNSHDTVIPGVRDSLRQLFGKLGMAIVTSSRRDHFEIIHSRSGLLPYFDFVLTREDYQRTKPSPEPYLLALRKSGLSPDQCLVVEDSPRGLAAAKAAGLTCWVIPGFQSSPRDFTDADRIFDNISEIAAVLV